ncbi:MAG: helix-turn-helix domain-containing protein [Pyrinomonadaceae bacterium]|nr:helix-turn-helix domain-containing protein [Pyrinomonadaceae bacterium]
MANSLGEKLRQAREDRGISISEVAEQTRISSLYLEGIEADDYRALPGGIFNKGFVKSYAKYVGLDEQEALSDYARLIASQDNNADDDSKVYRPEVLTDDRSNSSSFLTIVFAVVILGLISWGAYTFAKYYGESSGAATEASPTPEPAKTQDNSNTSLSNETNSSDSTPVAIPDKIAVEIKAVSENVSVTYTMDGEKRSQLVSPDASLSFTANESAEISYSKYQSANVQMVVNGKQIALPQNPENPNRQAIDLNLTKQNLVKILEAGKIECQVPVEGNTNSNVNSPVN